jgi:hypothetical protein
MHGGGDHQLVGPRAPHQLGETLPHGLGIPGDLRLLPLTQHRLLGRAVLVGGCLLGRGKAPGPAAAKPHEGQPARAGEPAGPLVRLGADHRHPEHEIRLVDLPAGPKRRAVRGGGEVGIRGGEVMGEGEGQAERPGDLRPVVGRAKHPDRRLLPDSGGGGDAAVGVVVRPLAGEVTEEFEQLLREVVDEAVGAAQRPGGELVGAWRPADAEVDPPRMQRFEHAELLGHHERSVVREHHPT